MKTFYLTLVLVTGFCLINTTRLKAADTLTRAQVYNFNVGDSFEYLIKYECTPCPNELNSVSYVWLIVTAKYYNPDSSVINYVFKGSDVVTIDTFRPSGGPPVSFMESHVINDDTMRYAGLNSFAVFYGNYMDTICTVILNTDSLQGTGVPVNSINNGCGETGSSFSFGVGIGEVAGRYGGLYDGTQPLDWDTSLIYFSKDTLKWGTPVYLDVNDVSNNNQISVFPNPCSNQLNINSSAQIGYVRIFDLTGRLVYTGKFQSQSIRLNILNLECAVYTLCISPLSGGAETITRKLVVAR